MKNFTLRVKILKLDQDLPTPRYAHEGDAGVDLYSAQDYLLKPGECKIIPTGIKLAIPQGYEAQIRPRSGLASKYSLSILNTPGTIDHQYRGEVGVIMVNFGKNSYQIKKGDRIAQMVFNKIEQVKFEEVQKLDETERNEGGFGSTGR